ncbi:Capsule assembly protein Wzi [Dyadobacter sp. SG02]|uniref:capsule assembly Wzi family protein n=1 Tax=Dyadobacter sp. SG02 TaxID=1855291 RepID=UPI0008C7602E|nr:capsule assembly Wzi family protein [Dyadobacter sp. SG02]SEJ72637.1 Capsule assembly protein Wzi [Dyadobacter sp. SG02]
MKISLLPFLFVLFSHFASAQRSLLKLDLEAQGSVTTGDAVPFWMRSNQYGSVPIDGGSAGFIVRTEKAFSPSRDKFFDWGAGFEGRLNAGNRVKALLIQGYGKIRLGAFQIRGGRFRETTGLADTLLTSGSFSVSGNALGVPKIELSVPEFYALPILKKFIAIKGSYAHGWMGTLPIHFPYRQVDEAKTYLHQKSLYLRFGTPASKLKVFAGLNDNVQWGNNKSIFSKNEFTLSPWEEYRYVVFSKRFEYSQVGNHLGSVDIGFTYEAPSMTIMLYRQSFYDKDGLKHLANAADGINGISFTSKTPDYERLHLKKVVFETVYTKNQSADAVKRLGLLGYEDYYNNYIYREGWSYHGASLGTPLITTTLDGSKDLPRNDREYFLNNRLLAFHGAVSAGTKAWSTLLKLTYSMNYGTFSTEKAFGKRSQFSGYLEARKVFRHDFSLGLAAALDAGDVIPSSVGVITKLTKSF